MTNSVDVPVTGLCPLANLDSRIASRTTNNGTARTNYDDSTYTLKMLKPHRETLPTSASTTMFRQPHAIACFGMEESVSPHTPHP